MRAARFTVFVAALCALLVIAGYLWKPYVLPKRTSAQPPEPSIGPGLGSGAGAVSYTHLTLPTTERV